MLPDALKWEEWLIAIEERGVNLTVWESEFVDSIRTKFDHYKSNVQLSERQVEQLERIYAERT